MVVNDSIQVLLPSSKQDSTSFTFIVPMEYSAINRYDIVFKIGCDILVPFFANYIETHFRVKVGIYLPKYIPGKDILGSTQRKTCFQF